jgi:hypothetical protein
VTFRQGFLFGMAFGALAVVALCLFVLTSPLAWHLLS